MAAKKHKSINLLPQEGFESSNAGRILKWALSTFRAMVIITEMVVMAAFMSRFWLDAKNSDLNDEINIDKIQVQAFSDIEKEFRNDQKRLAIAKSLYSETKKTDILQSVTGSLPPDVSLVSITLSGSTLQMKAKSGSERSIAQLLTNLGGNDYLKDPKLSQLSSSVDNGAITTFTVSAEILAVKKGETSK